MEAIVGIDPEANYRRSLALLGRLGFEDCHLHLVCAVQPEVDVLTPIAATRYAGGAAVLDSLEQPAKDSIDLAERSLKDAAIEAFTIDPQPYTATLFGSAADKLMAYADEVRADLVCVHSSAHGPMGAFAMGSIGRALTIAAKQSVLVSKGQVAPSGPVRAVFASDLSKYSERALDQLNHSAIIGNELSHKRPRSSHASPFPPIQQQRQ